MADAGFVAMYVLLIAFAVEMMAWVVFKRAMERKLPRNKTPLSARVNGDVCIIATR